MAKSFSISAIFAAKDKLSAPIAKIAGHLSSLGRAGKTALGGMNKAVDRGIGAMGKLADVTGVAGVVSLGALAFEMGNVIEKGRELEKTLIKTGSAFETPVRAGTAEFAKMTAAVRNVGATTEFSTQQAAEGLNSLATAGYSLEQSISALPGIIDFASAATLELGQASDITSDTLGAFALRTDNAAENTANMARVMDVLTRAAADSTTNVAELFEGIRSGGAFAKTTGATLEQFAALQGTLANKGIKGAEAGTAIRNAYLHLTTQTKQAAEAQAALGVKTAKNKDGSIDMITTIGRFSKATQKLSKDQKAQAISTIFGAFAVGPFLSLMDAGEDSVRAFSERLEGATGVTKEMAAAMRQSTDAKIAMFWNKIENLRLTVFDAIAPTILTVADAVGKWVTANEKLIGTKATEWAEQLKVWFGELVDNLPTIVTWVERIGVAFGVFVVAAAAVKTLNLAIALYEGVTIVAAGVTWLWNAALGAGVTAASSFTLATVAQKVATIASNAVTWLANAAQFALNYQINMSTLAQGRAKIAMIASKVATVAGNVVTWLATAAQTAYAAIVGGSTVALGGFTTAAGAASTAVGAQVAAFAPLLITLAAAAAAVGALYLAWDQYNKLDKSLEGSGGVGGTLSKMVEMGTFDPFEAHDAVMNDKAREARAKADQQQRENDRAGQMVSPQDRAASAMVDAQAAAAQVNVGGTITVEQKPGTKATAKAAPKAPPLVVKKTGAFG